MSSVPRYRVYKPTEEELLGAYSHMFKKLFIPCLFLISMNSQAQKVTPSQFLQIFKLFESKDRAHEISDYLKSLNSNWYYSPKDKKEENRTVSVMWRYEIDNHLISAIMGSVIDVGKDTFKPLEKVSYSFADEPLFGTYYRIISEKGELVSSYKDDDGSLVNVIDASGLIFMFTVYPKNLKSYFKDGMPVEHYLVELHRKL